MSDASQQPPSPIFEYAAEIMRLGVGIKPDTPPGPGSKPLYDATLFQDKMKNGVRFEGSANNILSLDLTRAAITNQRPGENEVIAYGQKHFSVSAALEKKEPLHFKHPVIVVVSDKESPGKAGTLRKISMDIQTYGFLHEWRRWLKAPKTGENGKIRNTALDLFTAAALHCPMDYHYIESGPQFEEEVFLKGVQLREDFRRDEEEHAPGGWEMACIFAQARRMRHASVGDDSHEGVRELMCKIVYAESSDYNCNKDKRTVEDGLRVYDRVCAANATYILENAKVKHGAKSPLCQLSKIIVLSQRVFASKVSNPEALFLLSLQILSHRLSQGCVATDISVNTLRKDEVPSIVILSSVMLHLKETFVFGPVETDILSHAWDPESWVKAMSSGTISDHAIVARPSAKKLRDFVAGLYDGTFDSVLIEIAHQNMKKASPYDLFTYGKFPGMAILAEYKEEIRIAEEKKKQQEDNATKLKEAQLSAVSQAEGDDFEDAFEPEIVLEGDGDPINTDAAVDATVDKDTKLKEFREEMVRSVMPEHVIFVVRPADKTAWQKVMAENVFLQNCDGIEREGVTRHLWFYDPAADQEPTLSSANQKPESIPAQPDQAAARLFYETAASSFDRDDLYAWCDNRSPQARSTLSKMVKEAKVEEVKIIYKEPSTRQQKNRHKLVEGVSAFYTTQPPSTQGPIPRLHYTLTSRASDCICMADMATSDDLPKYPKSTKEAILTNRGILPREQSLPAVSEVHVFHQEKTQRLYEEIFHHFSPSTIALLSGGCGNAVLAAVRLGMKIIVFARNSAQADVIKGRLTIFMVEQSLNNAQCPYYVSRADMISNHGLEPD